MGNFKVFGIGRNNKKTLLHDDDLLSNAIRWAERYVSRENAGNWKHIQVVDRTGVNLTMWQWSSDHRR